MNIPESNTKKVNPSTLNIQLNFIVAFIAIIFKIVKFLKDGEFIFNIFDIAVFAFSIGSILLTLLISKEIENSLMRRTLLVTLTSLSLLFLGFSLIVYNDPSTVHLTIYTVYTLVLFLGSFVLFYFNTVGLNIDENEKPDVRLNLIFSIVGALVVIILIAITNYISEKYYNGTLSIFVGSVSSLLASISSMVVGINVKKLRKGLE